jgi:hypothetical protein
MVLTEELIEDAKQCQYILAIRKETEMFPYGITVIYTNPVTKILNAKCTKNEFKELVNETRNGALIPAGTELNFTWKSWHFEKDFSNDHLIRDLPDDKVSVYIRHENAMVDNSMSDFFVHFGEATVQNGNGYIFHRDGSFHTGMMLNGVLNGNGTWERWDGNLRYSGEYKNGVIDGKALIEEEDHHGTVLYKYDGLLKNNIPHYFGKLNSIIEGNYVGQWKNGKRHGYGCIENIDGTRYSGNWKNDTYDGEGIFRDHEGYYEGNWRDGMKHGYGSDVVKSEGRVYSFYSGHWKNNKRNGWGEFRLFGRDVEESDVCYKGQWQDGMKHGYGTMLDENGEIRTGVWREDVFQRYAQNTQTITPMTWH